MRASDITIRTLSLIAAATAVTGLAGCGGGGGGDSSGPATPVANAMRTLLPGDTWKYSVTADIVPTTGSTIRLKDGSFTRSVGTYASTTASLKGKALNPKFMKPKVAAPGLGLTENLSLSYYGGLGIAENNVSHIFLESDGIYQISDTRDIDGNEEGAEPFVTPVFTGQQQILPMSFSDSSGFASDDAYGVPVFVQGTPDILNPDGTVKTPGTPDKTTEKVTNHEQFSMVVSGKEDVDTPIGRYSTYKVTVSRHYVTQGVTISGTEWWAPQIGSFVKANYTEVLPGVGTEHLGYTIKEMHLATAG